jgi:triosephosphate isomerase
MTKRKLLIANWKTYIQDLDTARDKIEEINSLLGDVDGVVICPPFIYLQVLVSGLEKSSVDIGSQNISASESTNTGEILAIMQKEIGCDYAILGHSEVRELYKESSDTVAAKVRIALRHGIIPIVCIGETAETRSNGHHLKFLIDQLIASLPQTEGLTYDEIIIAYEPIWSIGTGKVPTATQIEEVLSTLRLIPGLENCKFLYGGSVNEVNIEEISAIQSVDGVLVGAASTDIKKLYEIYKKLRLQ